MMKRLLPFYVLLFFLIGCENNSTTEEGVEEAETAINYIEPNNKKYVPVKLTTDLSVLSDNQKAMIPLLIEAGKIMDELFWYEAHGGKEELLASIEDENTKRFVEINYGPWDRLEGNAPFVEGVGAKPEGANFYPMGMTKEMFNTEEVEGKESLYTFLRWGEEGLVAVPYHKQFAEQVQRASDLLLKAADLAEEAGLKKYLTLRAAALLNDEYFESDMAWMDMKDNQLDVVIGPIETYEDQLFGYKAAHECYVLVKDMDWSAKLAKYAAFLPELQRGIPVEEAYKQEKPGTNSQLNAYDVIYYAGDCNSGSKTIAINLPNDERVQIAKGSRRLQLKNAMQAKFDKILVPISEVLIAEEQRKHITFDAFFSNTMFHEVAHGLGIKNVINKDSVTVRKALKEHASALEEGKADILGIYMVTQLHKKGEISGDLKDYYVTFMASIFRSVRFGASSAHGKANMIRFNYFKEQGVFERQEDGTYKVNFDKMSEAIASLSKLILTLQGDGDYDGVGELVAEKGKIEAQLQADLDLLGEKGIPVDVVFEQGAKVLGL